MRNFNINKLKKTILKNSKIFFLNLKKKKKTQNR